MKQAASGGGGGGGGFGFCLWQFGGLVDPVMGSGMSSSRRSGSTWPTATAALVAANVLVFFRPGPLDAILPKEYDAAFKLQHCLKLSELHTFFLSSFYHGNETHLFGNMAGLLLMGVALEGYMGSAEFASMVAALAGVPQAIKVLLCKALCLLFDDDGDDDDDVASYFDYDSIGFSGVLFGMEAVLASSYATAPGRWMSIPVKYVAVPLELAVWAHLFLVQDSVPEADVDFLGHLCGLLTGFLYHWLKRALKREDPLTFLVSTGIRSSMDLTARLFAQKKISTGSGSSSSSASDDGRPYPRGIWTCSTCTYYNSIATDTCETCSTMREDRAFSRRRQHHQEAWCNANGVDRSRRHAKYASGGWTDLVGDGINTIVLTKFIRL